MLLEGTETFPDRRKSPVLLHLGAGGRVAASVPDPGALAADWLGTWTLEGRTLTADLAPVAGIAAPIRVVLDLKPSGRGKGSILRTEGPDPETRLAVRAIRPSKPKGWTAVVPRLRHAGGTAAGDFRGTLVLRRLDLPTGKAKKDRPLVLQVRAVAPDGLPGHASTVELPPGRVVRLEGGALPPLPPGVAPEERQFEITGGKGFEPGRASVAAREEVLRGPGEAPSGGAATVHWVQALPAGKRAALGNAPVAAPLLRDDGGVGDPDRAVVLVLRDAAALSGAAPLGSVKVSVRTPAGVEVAGPVVDLPTGAAISLSPADLGVEPGDLPGGEGQVVVLAADGGDLPRGSLAAALVETRLASGVATGVAHAACESPPAGAAPVRALAPFVPAAGARVTLVNLGTATLSVPVEARDAGGTLLDAVVVDAPAGAAVRLDPEGAGMDAEALGGAEDGRVSLRIGGTDGLAPGAFVLGAALDGAAGEVLALPAPVDAAAPAPVSFVVEDVEETAGLGTDGADTEFTVANAGATTLTFSLRPYTREGDLVGDIPGFSFAVASGGAVRVPLEQALAAAGAPLGAGDRFRGSVVLAGDGPGPAAVLARLVLGGTGGAAASTLPVLRR